MPTYLYECQNLNCDGHRLETERNVSIDLRDDQDCARCNYPLSRKIAFTGLTWAPTAGGMR